MKTGQQTTMTTDEERIIGKYKVICNGDTNQPHTIVTDNPLEAVWEANKSPERKIINVCGEREIYLENGEYKVRK